MPAEEALNMVNTPGYTSSDGMLHTKQGVVPCLNLPRSCTNIGYVGEDGTFFSGRLPGSDVVWIS